MTWSISGRVNFTFDSTNEGIITNENVTKDANLMPFPLIGLDSDETDVFDFGGTTRMITLTVEKSGTTSAINTFIQTKLLALINGDQSDTLTYVSDRLGTVYVKVMNVTFDIVGGTPTKFIYTLKLIEATQGV